MKTDTRIMKTTEIQVGKNKSNGSFSFGIGAELFYKEGVSAKNNNNHIEIPDETLRNVLPHQFEPGEIKTYQLTLEEVVDVPERITGYSHGPLGECGVPESNNWTVEEHFDVLSGLFGSLRTDQGRIWGKHAGWSGPPKKEQKGRNTIQVARTKRRDGGNTLVFLLDGHFEKSEVTDNGWDHWSPSFIEACHDVAGTLLPRELEPGEFRTYYVTFEEVEKERITEIRFTSDTPGRWNYPVDMSTDPWTVEDDFEHIAALFSGFRTHKGRTWTKRDGGGGQWDREL